MSQYDSCTNCFRPLNGSVVCPYCGHDRTKERQYMGVLPPFTTLNNKYLIGRVLGKGGFGITYNAISLETNRICAVKEYMPAEYSTRSGSSAQVVPFSDSKAQYVFNHGREKFVLEAQTLLKLVNDPIVVDIWDYFNENNTAYIVMEYLEGDDLRKMARANGGTLDADFMKNVFVTVASSLMEIHKLNILHRDLSPENIIVTKQGNIKLIDFGAARNFVSTQNKGMSILLKPGFAPPEQYNAKGDHGPWSDVYALCATFYNLVSGKPLIDALFRYRGEVQPSLSSLGCNVSKKTSDVIEKGMELDYKKRYRDFKELLDDIDIVTTPRQVQTPQPQYSQTQYAPPQSAQQYVQQQPQPAQQYVQQSQQSGQQQYSQQSQQSYQQPQTIDNAQNCNTNMSRLYVAAVVGGGIRNKIMINTSDIFNIGRSQQSCQYVISGDTNISRTHCHIRVDGSNMYLTDVSANGTFLSNGYRLEKNKEYKINIGVQFYLATPNHMLVVGM